MPQARHHPDHAARQRAYRERQARARSAELQAKGLPPSPPLPTMPSRARWHALITHARLSLETARDEMQTYYDGRSAAWQEGERAALLSDHLEALEQVLDSLDDLPPL
jgi:hypothetical protein